LRHNSQASALYDHPQKLIEKVRLTFLKSFPRSVYPV